MNTFTLPSSNQAIRDSVMTAVSDHVSRLDDDKVYSVIIQEQQESRRDVQNALMWRWHGQFGKHIGHSPDYVHSMIKLDILLPLMRTSEKQHKRTLVIDYVLSNLPERKHKLFIAHDQIRSSDLTIKEFSEFLTAYQQYAAGQGCVLTGREDELMRAMAA